MKKIYIYKSYVDYLVGGEMKTNVSTVISFLADSRSDADNMLFSLIGPHGFTSFKFDSCHECEN